MRFDVLLHCTGCSACLANCPKDAIAFKADAEGFMQPEIDDKRCINCGLCTYVCPLIQKSTPDPNPRACYSVCVKDTETLRLSSSGGVFSCLACEMLSRGGHVFGCAMTAPDWVARHIEIADETELAALRGSKYVQSQVGNTFRKCKKQLDEGGWVLYSGTPCQILGLRNYLRHDYERLLTVDFICHGVPSPHVWSEYLRRIARKGKESVRRVSFRDKRHSWKRSSLAIEFSNGDDPISETLDQNDYLRAFIGNLCLRRSCYCCPAKEGRSGSDVTVADFWRVEEVHPELFNPSGVSAFIVHTPKGQEWLEAIKRYADVSQVQFHDIVRANPSYSRSVEIPRGRRVFMKHYKTTRSWGKLIRSVRRGPFFIWITMAVLRRMKCFWETRRNKE